MFVVAPPPHPRQRLPSLDSGKGSKQVFTEFLPLFLQKESGVWGNAPPARIKEKQRKLFAHSLQMSETKKGRRLCVPLSFSHEACEMS